jgi:hypothetical protein
VRGVIDRDEDFAIHRHLLERGMCRQCICRTEAKLSRN